MKLTNYSICREVGRYVLRVHNKTHCPYLSLIRNANIDSPSQQTYFYLLGKR